MTSMPATHGHSAACCNVPPVVSRGYEKKGSYHDIGGYKTYVSGSDSATKAVVVVYDIFGFVDQTIQGADIMSHACADDFLLVFMPDWFRGRPFPLDSFPPDTPEKKRRLREFFEASPPASVAALIPAYVDALKRRHPSLQKLAIVGYCWGAKVVTIAIKDSAKRFHAAAALHPAMLDPNDARDIAVPFALLASMDENPDDVAAFERALKAPHHVESFQDQIHGWMAARADLSNDRVKHEYERGYQILIDFFCKHL